MTPLTTTQTRSIDVPVKTPATGASSSDATSSNGFIASLLNAGVGVLDMARSMIGASNVSATHLESSHDSSAKEDWELLDQKEVWLGKPRKGGWEYLEVSSATSKPNLEVLKAKCDEWSQTPERIEEGQRQLKRILAATAKPLTSEEVQQNEDILKLVIGLLILEQKSSGLNASKESDRLRICENLNKKLHHHSFGSFQSVRTTIVVRAASYIFEGI